MTHDPYAAPVARAVETAPASRWRAWLGAAWIAATLGVVALAVYASLDPGNYFFYDDEDRAAWKVQPLPIFVVCTMIVLEGVVVHRVWFGRRWRAWRRALLALVFLVPWMGVVSMIFMHMPRYVHLHILWVWLATAAVAVTFLYDGLVALAQRGVGSEATPP